MIDKSVVTVSTCNRSTDPVSHNIGNKTKGRISKRVLQEKARQIFGKTNISYVLIRTPTEDKKCSFFGKFGVLCFLETSVLRFGLSPYYRQICHKSKILTLEGVHFDHCNKGV